MTTYRTLTYWYQTNQTYNSSVALSTGDTYVVTSSATVDKVWFQYLSSENIPTTTTYAANVTKTSTTTYSILPTNGYLPSGKFKVLVHSTTYGYHTVSPSTFTKAWPATPTFSPVSSSFVGGQSITLTGAGFLT